MRIARRRFVGLADNGRIAEHRQHCALQRVIERQVAIEPAADVGKCIAQRLGDIECHRRGAVSVVDHSGDQRNGLGDAVDGDGQGRRAGEGLAVAELVAHDQLAFVEEVLAEGKVVGNRQVQGVLQGVARRNAGVSDVGLQSRGFDQRDRFGDEFRSDAGAAEVDGGVRCGDVPRVERHPLAGRTWRPEGDGHRVAGDRVDDRQAIGVDFRYIKRHHGIGLAGEAVVHHGKRVDVHVIGGDQHGYLRGIGHHRAVVQGDRGQSATGTGGDGGDLDVVRQWLGNDHIGKRLTGRRGYRHGERTAKVGPGGGFTFRRAECFVEGDDGRMHHKRCGAGFDQAGVVGRVVQRIVAELEAAAGADGQVRAAIGKVGVGQIAQAGCDLHWHHWLLIGDAGERQFDHHEFIAGPHAVRRGVDDQEIAIGVFGQRMGGVAIGVECHNMADQVVAQIAGGDEVDPVVAVLAGSG
ncbi:hypothetical protein D3C71_788860 [compost metagenome]